MEKYYKLLLQLEELNNKILSAIVKTYELKDRAIPYAFINKNILKTPFTDKDGNLKVIISDFQLLEYSNLYKN